MQDLIYVAAFVAFFVLAGLFVFACDKLIGSDEAALAHRGGTGRSPAAKNREWSTASPRTRCRAFDRELCAPATAILEDLSA